MSLHHAALGVLVAGLVSGAVLPVIAGDNPPYPPYGASDRSSKVVRTSGSADMSELAVSKAKCALETLRDAVEEWGTLTVSEPIVILDTGQFNLGDKFDTTQDYIKRAREASVQGSASQTHSTTLGNSLNIQVSPTYSLDPSGNKTPLANSATALDPSASEASPPTITAPAAIEATKPPTFQLSDAVAVPLGESAKITESLGRTMANPATSRFTNPDVAVHFAIVQISCNPGWRTRENYIGDVTATCEFYRSKDHTFQPESDQVRPLVFSVLPLFDAQTLELASSQQGVAQLVAQLAAAYPTTVANLRASDLIKLTKQFRSDAATRTPRTVTNSYSTGSSFGFRFSPSLVALKDPAQRHSGAANILQATSFPALVTIIVNNHHATANQYDSVLVHVAHHWFINDRPPAREFWRRWSLPLKRDRVAADHDLAQTVDDARAAVFALGDLGSSHLGPATPAAVTMLYRQYQELRAKATGSSHPVFSIPLAAAVRRARGDAPVINDVTPQQIMKSGPVAMVIRGFNFFGPADKYQVWLGQRQGSVQTLVHASTQDDQMFVTFPAASEKAPSPDEGKVPLILVGPQGMDAKPDAVEIVKPSPSPASSPAKASPDKPPPADATPDHKHSPNQVPAAPAAPPPLATPAEPPIALPEPDGAPTPTPSPSVSINSLFPGKADGKISGVWSKSTYPWPVPVVAVSTRTSIPLEPVPFDLLLP